MSAGSDTKNIDSHPELEEIDQIMSDIESLQKEIEDTGTPTSEADGILLSAASDGDVSMEDTLGALGEDSESELLKNELANDEPAPGKVIPMRSNDQDSGSLTLHLKGSMTLNLSYENDGQSVTVSFDDGVMRVELANGVEFKLPLTSAPKAAGKKSA